MAEDSKDPTTAGYSGKGSTSKAGEDAPAAANDAKLAADVKAAQAKGVASKESSNSDKSGTVKGSSAVSGARAVAATDSKRQGVQQGASELLKRTKSSTAKAAGTVLDTQSSVGDKAAAGASTAAGAGAAAAVSATGVGAVGAKVAAEAASAVTSKTLGTKKRRRAIIVFALVIMLLPTLATVGAGLIAVTSITAITAAVDQNQKAAADSAAGTCTPSGIGSLTGNGVEEKVWFALRSAGWTEEQAAGIMGNIAIESSFNPFLAQDVTATPNVNAGWGLVQWTADRHALIRDAVKGAPSLGDRYYVAAPSQDALPSGITEADLDAMVLFQINFILGELNGVERAAADHLRQQTTVNDATLSFLNRYERAGTPHADRRTSEAQRYYDAYSGKTAPAGEEPATDTDGGAVGETDGAGTNLVGESEAAAGLGAGDACAGGGGAVSGDAGGPTGVALGLADGYPYVFGGGGSAGPSGGYRSADAGEIGYDCSGVTQHAYSQAAGIELPRTARAQWAALKGNQVDAADIQPGDLIFWAYGRLGSTVSHVAIYVGNGQMIEASISRNRVVLTPARLSGSGFVGVARVMDSGPAAESSAPNAEEVPDPPTAGPGTTFE